MSLMVCGDCKTVYGPTVFQCPKCGSGNVSRGEVRTSGMLPTVIPMENKTPDPSSPAPIGEEELREIKARAEKALRGPWKAGGCVVYTVPSGGRESIVAHTENYANCENDAAFIAAARSDIPRLLGEIARLRAELDRREK